MTGGHPEYRYLAGAEDPHLFTFKSGTNFSIGMADLKTLLRNGMSRIQVNDPGHITIYFLPMKSEGESTLPDFKQMGRDAYVKGLTRVPVHDPAVSSALKQLGNVPGAVSKALDEWLRGWDEANIAAPVT